MKTALQIYSLRKTVMEDPRRHLEAIRRMGYDGVELVNLGEGSIPQLAACMKQTGLEVFSCHININHVLRADPGEIRAFADLGLRFLTIGWLPEERLAGGPLYEETVRAIRAYSVLCREAGVRLLYHNHDFDFVRAGEKHRLDVLYADLNGEELGAELDTCWIYSGGEDPLDYLKKYGGRCPVLHLKDCVRAGGRSGFMPLGQGVLDFPPILTEAAAQGVEWLCVEQDEPCPGKTAAQCAEESAAFLLSLLKK